MKSEFSSAVGIYSVIGKDNLCGDCNEDPFYKDPTVNEGLIPDNFDAWLTGIQNSQYGQTRAGFVTQNVEEHPVSMTIVGTALQAIALTRGGWGNVTMNDMLITGAIGGGANVGAQYYFNDGDVNLPEAALAFGTGAASSGQGLSNLILLNSGNVFNTSAIKGENPNTSLALTLAAVPIGYGFGELIENAGSAYNVIGQPAVRYFPGEFVPVSPYQGVYTEFTRWDAVREMINNPSVFNTVSGTISGAVMTEGAGRWGAEQLDKLKGGKE